MEIWPRVLIGLFGLPSTVSICGASCEPSLFEIQKILAPKRFVDLGAGFFAETFAHVGQWGTHVDVHAEAAKNPDYMLSLERVKKWEAAHGPIPAGVFVAMRTDWSKRWPDEAAMANKDGDGVAHYPG